jgi:S-adenosylmethionine hydrolase
LTQGLGLEGKMSIITLTTDFGTDDAYVAAMKGVMLTLNPNVTLVDVTHYIQPQNVSQAAFVLSTACPFFPAGTVHLIVVDPDVGTGRKAIIVRTPSAYFVAPDNGVLSYVIDQSGQETMDIFEITRPEYWRLPVSPTFHGRDIFAPVAARLSLGFPASDFGESLSSLELIPVSHPVHSPDGSLTGHIIHIDSFGNLITDIKETDLKLLAKEPTIEIGHHTISGLSHTYANARDLLALIGSSGYLEISRKNGSAAAMLNVLIGDAIILR